MHTSRAQVHVAVTAFLALFAIVGVALYGLPFFYDHMVREFGWTRQQVTSGNAYSKLGVRSRIELARRSEELDL